MPHSLVTSENDAFGRTSTDSTYGEALRIRNLSKSYEHDGQRRRVLEQFNLEVDAGEFVALLGPSGCGKTTLLRILTGLDEPDPCDSSEVSLGEKPVTGPGPDRGIVFQSYSSFPWLTAKDNVAFGLRYICRDRQDREARALKYLDLVGLREYAGYYAKALSGGQQQRVAIARTLAMHPKLLMMDEPYAALDAQHREIQQGELLRVWRATRPTILFVTHDISEAAFLGQRVVVLSNQPAKVLAEFRTTDFLETRIAQSRRRDDIHAAHREIPTDLPASYDSAEWRAGEAGQWLRSQPEFFEFVAQLRKALPGPANG
jgi:NitT/TauT family transport system ATP-binding protein